MPIVTIFGFFNLLVLYFTNKYGFIRNGSWPMRMSHCINRMVIKILLVGVLIHCIITPIFLGAPGIATDRSHYISTDKNAHHKGNEIGGRYGSPYGILYLLIAAMVIIYLLFRKQISSCVHSIKSRALKSFSKGSSEPSQKEKESEYFGLYPSYSMHHDPKYEEILKNIYIMNEK